MGQIGWRDPVTGAEAPFDQWLAEAEAYGEALGFPYEILKGIYDGIHKERPEGLSVTMMLGCPRAVTIKGLTEYYTDAQDDYAAFRGTLVHGLLEKNKIKGSVVERRMFREFRGVMLSGQLDKFSVSGAPDSFAQAWLDWADVADHPDAGPPPVLPEGARFVIEDYKTKHELPFGNYVYQHHQEQGNLYRWLLRLPKDKTDIRFIYVTMKGVKVMHLFDGGTYANGRAKPAQMWTDAQVETFLSQKLMPLTLAQKRQVPVAYDKVPDEALWECTYCPVLRDCYRLAADEAHHAWENGIDVLRVAPRVVEKKK